MTVRHPEMRATPGHIPKSGMLISEYLARFKPTGQTLEARYEHRLGPGVPLEDLRKWEASHPNYPLPDSLRELLLEIDGIHLWADGETGRSYQGLAPLHEWDTARVVMYGPESAVNLLDSRYLAISYHADCAAYIVLDVGAGHYFLMDTAGPDESCPIGRGAPELLDWLWKYRMAPET